jgi:hypothetical protein
MKAMLGRRAGALLSGLACAGALKTHAQEERKIKALYVTSSFPKDTMPIDVMVHHQLNTLSGPNVELRAVVFDNQPPWLEVSDFKASYRMQHQGLKRLQEGRIEKLPKVTVKAMDYAGIDDPNFLAPFFDVDFRDASGSRLAQKSLSEMYGTAGERAQMLSNFFAMTSFMEECARPEHKDVDLCVYFDPDMLMYQNSSNILELATTTFEDDPEFAVLSPPLGCFQAKWWQKDKVSGACASRPAIVSSRHVIADRKRLLSQLPITVRPNDIGKNYWEVTMTEAMGRAGRGQILCGQEFFVVHPPSRYQKNQKAATITGGEAPMTLREMLAQLTPRSRCSGATPEETCSAEAQAALGTRELVRRFEAGMLIASKETLYNQGCGCCADMMPSAGRIKAGEAFFQPRGALEYDMSKNEANDAAFEWVVRCTQ